MAWPKENAGHNCPRALVISGRIANDRTGYKTELRLRRRPDNSETGISVRAANGTYKFTNVPEGKYQG
ncbi:MAG TPA: hypothetical protein VIR01_18745 [Pyrinomonadaceae bacterium]